jgi:hypothetical protein
MTRILTTIALSLVLLVSAQAIAADAGVPSTISKHQMFVQMVNCMKKLMSANKELSYNAAERVCRVQVNSQSNSSETATRVASDSRAKP